MTPAQYHMSKVGRLGCVVCWKAFGVDDTPALVHHVAEGSGKRSDFSVAPLCHTHHVGSLGFHGMGTDNQGNRLAWGNPTTDYSYMAGEYWAARKAQQGIFAHT